MVQEITTTLRCSSCLKETPMSLTYVGPSLVRIRCRRCGASYKVNDCQLCRAMVRDWGTRVSTKPWRMVSELEHDTCRFCLGLPGRLLTKPWRVARELNQLER